MDSLRQNFQALAQEDDIEEGDEEGDGDGTAAQGAGGAPAAAGAEEAGAQTTKTITGKELWDMQWATTTTEDGVTYHANKYTFESSWVPPTQPTEWDEEAAALVRAPWMLCWTAAGTSLWLNTTSGEQQQECPFPKGPDFIAAEKFEGSKKGYFFKRGGLGLGYYKDGVAHASGDAGGEDSAAAQAGEKRKRKRKNKPKWKKSKINTYVYAEGLPTDTTAEEVAAYFGKFGVLRPDENDGKTPKIKLYTDAAGNLKGDARVGYLKEASIPICLQLADGAPFRDGKFPLKVALATFEMKGDTFKPSEAPDEEAKARRAKNLLALKKKERELDWGADEGAPRAAALSRAHSTHTLPALRVERGAFLCCTERLSQRRRPRTHAERDGTHGAGVDDGRGLRIVILRGMFTIAEMDADLDVSLSP